MLEHLPNALTALRIAAVPVLAWLAIVRDGDFFVAVLIACLIGDVVDGRLARALNATSSLGAQLDSIADTLLFLAAAGGIAVFHAEVRLRAKRISGSQSMAHDEAMRRYEEQYDAVKAKLQAVGFIGQGSVQTRRIACGSPTCRCHQDPDARHGP